MPEQITILVADDHPIVRDGLKAILGTQFDFQVVGEAADGIELVRKALQLKPDLILMDLQMPGMDGAEALKAIHAVAPGLNAIVLTAFDTDERIIGAVQAGARGYLLKGAPRDEIFNAVRIVSQGGSLLQPAIASKVLKHISATASAPAPTAAILTEREAEILALMAQGKPNKEIASALFISERTVKFHVSAILAKLDAGNRTDAVRIAAQKGLIHL